MSDSQRKTGDAITSGAPEDSASSMPTFDFNAAIREGPGSKIGNYKLLQLLGEGGFGSVFLADQEHPVRRKVALKIIKLGMDTRQVIARFEQERQALAMMDHPNIAKVLDAGATETGRPYFVMELVKGEPITDYCDKNNFSVSERLELFTQVCQAVQHAHQKGLIHRDLKPSNILVQTQNDRPHAKVIDFGIAKATNSRLTEKTIFTEHRQLVGTPEYMSPEQAEGSFDIDTRTDVYALGVLLYELLTGRTPFDGKALRSAAHDEMMRIIREEEPVKPSTRLSNSPDTLMSVAAQRHTEPKRLNSLIRGELDWIVMKALEKDRRRRYETANGLAMDVQRFLGGEPVSAAPPSRVYRLKKFARRHRGPVLAGALVTVALVLGIIGTTVGLVRAARDRDRARLALDEAEAVTKFVTDMLAAADPSKQGREVSVQTVLHVAENQIGPAFQSRPRVEARLRETIGRTYFALGDYARAQPHLDSAYKLSKEQFGAYAEQTVRLDASRSVAVASLGNLDEGERELNRVIEDAKTHLGAEHPETLTAMDSLAELYSKQGRSEEALKISGTVLDARTRVLGPEHSDTITAISHHAGQLADLRRFKEAEELYLKALSLQRRLLGAEHPETLLTMCNLQLMYYSMRRLDDAIRLGEQTLPLVRRVFGVDHSATLNVENNLAISYRSADRPADAEPLLLHDLEVSRRTLGNEHPDTLISIANVAKLYSDTGNLEKAEPLFAEAVAGHKKALPPGFFGTGLVLLGRGSTLNKLHRYTEAEKDLLESYQILSKQTGPEGSDVTRIPEELVITYSGLGLTDKADEWLAVRAKLKAATQPTSKPS